ncbi:MAG TPA: M28 family peptidase, partial [Chitinophagaceae bacterium]|nr:M28 family peptidase [Chitinophagaceae bacterium]
MRKLLLSGVLLVTIAAQGQKIANPTPFAKTITADDLKRHLYIVAGKEMEGRLTASPGQRKAAEYIQNEFKKLGLQAGNKGEFEQHFPVYQDSIISASFEVNGKQYEIDKDFNASTGNIPATLRFSEIVFIGAKTTDTIKNANLAGRLVLMIGGAGQPGGGGIMTTLASKGVVGVITVQSNYPRTTPANRKGGQTTNTFRRTITPQQYTISEAVARDILGSEFDNAKANTSTYKIFQSNISLDTRKTTITTESSNVLGYMEGTDLKDQYLFITAHYDHLGKRDSVIFYGADDDGSGTCAVIELAEAFAKAKAAGKGPRRTIVFMTVSGEEEGLWGSAFYGDHPAFPLDKTTVDLNIDMIGRIDPKRKVGDSMNYVYVVGDDKLSSDLKPISESMNKKYTKLELDYKYNDPKDQERIYFRSDHFNFARKGVPIIFYFNGT